MCNYSTIHILQKRGAIEAPAGIDGCNQYTAMGAAAATPEKSFVLITGDVSFQYDINALWNDQQIQNLKIIIINNGGGGILELLKDQIYR